MKKYAVEMKETYTRTIIVEAEDYLEAEDKVADAYYDGRIILDGDNSAIDVELQNDTENYIEIFGKEDFEKMAVEI